MVTIKTTIEKESIDGTGYCKELEMSVALDKDNCEYHIWFNIYVNANSIDNIRTDSMKTAYEVYNSINLSELKGSTIGE